MINNCLKNVNNLIKNSYLKVNNYFLYTQSLIKNKILCSKSITNKQSFNLLKTSFYTIKNYNLYLKKYSFPLNPQSLLLRLLIKK